MIVDNDDDNASPLLDVAANSSQHDDLVRRCRCSFAVLGGFSFFKTECGGLFQDYDARIDRQVDLWNVWMHNQRFGSNLGHTRTNRSETRHGDARFVCYSDRRHCKDFDFVFVAVNRSNRCRQLGKGYFALSITTNMFIDSIIIRIAMKLQMTVLLI